jgi:dynein heavy chain
MARVAALGLLSLAEHTPLARTWLAQVRREAMRVEIEYHDLEERYRTRELCGVLNDPTEKEAAHALRVTWAALAEETERVDESLEEVKAKFTEITRTQVICVCV